MSDVCARCHKPFASGQTMTGGWSECRYAVDGLDYHATCANLDETVDRVIDFLSKCSDGDIRSGIGAMLGLGSDEAIKVFREGIAEAIEPRDDPAP